MEIPSLYISLLLLVASYLFTYHIRRKSTNHPPTVFPTLPIIGHLYLLKPPLYRTLAKISAKFGPILHLQFGSRGVLVINSPSLAEQCFTKNDITFANRPRMLFGKIAGNDWKSLVWSPYGDNWRNLRRIASVELLSIHRLNEFHDIRVDEGKLLVRKLMSSSSPVNVKFVFYELTLNVMMRMISGKRYFGGDISEMVDEGRRFREILDETFMLASATNVVDYLPFLSWFGMTGLEKKLAEFRVKRDAFFQELIEQLRKPKSENMKTKKTMIEVLLSLQEAEPQYYNDEMIRSFVLVRSLTRSCVYVLICKLVISLGFIMKI
ncbi:putative isoflavone 3'-hydroxylase [Helianthus anomalus]